MRKISNIIPGPVCRSDTKSRPELQNKAFEIRPLSTPNSRQRYPLARRNNTWSLVSRTQPNQPFQNLDGLYRN